MRGSEGPFFVNRVQPTTLGLIVKCLTAILCVALLLLSCNSGVAPDRANSDWSSLIIDNRPDDALIDLSGQIFVVANSRNSNPTSAKTCKDGTDPVNPYPVAVIDINRPRVSNLVVAGRVPQDSGWQASYCNSAALRFEDADGPHVENVRMQKVWDGIRFGKGTTEFSLSNIRISGARDDCVENDYLAGGLITNVLLEDCFSGISMYATDPSQRPAAGSVLVLQDTLIKLRAGQYKENDWHAMPIKTNGNAPKLVIRSSVFAVDHMPMIGGRNAEVMWGLIESCSDNLLLIFSRTNNERELHGLPDCFTVISGAKARDEWAVRRNKWIERNPEIQGR